MSKIRLIESQTEEAISKKVLLRRIKTLEEAVEALQQNKSEDHTHTISAEAILSIAALVEADIVRKLQQFAPQETVQGEQPAPQEESAG